MATRVWLSTANGNWGTAANWSTTTVPTTGDHAIIPPGTPSITSGLNQSAVALGTVYFQKGYTGTVGSSSAPLQIDPDKLVFAGSGQAYIDCGSAAITPSISQTAVGSDDVPGLYIKGSALTGLAVTGNTNIAVAGLPGETADADAIRVNGAGSRVVLGEGATFTTASIAAGKLISYGVLATVNVNGGTLEHDGSGAVTALTVNSGSAYLRSSGNLTDVTLFGGTTDMLGSGLPRTIANLQANRGAIFRYDPEIVTITNFIPPTAPVSLSVSAP